MQGRDHPVLHDVPETYYLKCFILQEAVGGMHSRAQGSGNRGPESSERSAIRRTLDACSSSRSRTSGRLPRYRGQVQEFSMATRQTLPPLQPSDFTSAFPELPQGLRRRPAACACRCARSRSAGGEPPLRVYDTSGPQGHDVRDGLPLLRQRGSVARRRRERAAVADHRPARTPRCRALRRARPALAAAAGDAAALRAPRRRHAGDGVHRHPRRVRRRVRPRRKSRAAAPSSRPTSTIPSSSR